MFNVTVAANFSTHAEIKCTELYLIDLLSLGLMYAKKNHQLLSSTKKRCTQKKIGSFFSASWCIFLSACVFSPSFAWVVIQLVKRSSAIAEEPRDASCHWNLVSCHATVQKLLVRQDLNKSKSWSWGVKENEYDFLFDFNRNYASILYRYQDTAGYLSKVADFDPPHLHLVPP